MSQRNPMNERYQGDGPGGKTKKSAAKLKPKTDAAFSVHIEAKPTNKQERKAAKRKREQEEQRKAQERARKAQERQEKEMIAAGMIPPVPKKPSLLDKFFPKKPANPVAAAAGGKSITTTSAASPAAKRSPYPTSKKYKDLRKIYWVLIAIGVASVIATFIAQTNFAERSDIWGVLMGIAYISIIAGLILDFAKIRPLIKAHQKEMTGGGKKSPKQLKHAEEAAERARQIEEFNKAKKLARAQKRRELIGLGKKDGKGEGEADDIEDVAAGAETAGGETAGGAAVGAPSGGAAPAGTTTVTSLASDAATATAELQANSNGGSSDILAATLPEPAEEWKEPARL